MKFDYFTWEAFATLITGGLAVGAAVWVGLKQQRITAKQLENEKLRMRMELFKQRLDVFIVVKTLSGKILLRNEPILSSLYEDFRFKIRGLEFLFDQEIAKHVDDIWSNIDDLIKSGDDGYMVRNDDASTNDPAHDELRAAFRGLADRFRPWLSLSELR